MVVTIVINASLDVLNSHDPLLGKIKRRQLRMRLASYLWDTGGRHWGELGDVGPLHSCVGRNIL